MATHVLVKALLGCLPDSLIERLSVEHSVDRQGKKLKGKSEHRCDCFQVVTVWCFKFFSIELKRLDFFV